MPADAWPKFEVDDLIARGVLDVGDGYRATRSELDANGLPFARAGNINDGFHFDGAELLGWAGVRAARQKVSRPGDVVFTSKGTVGRFALVTPETPQFVYSPQLCFWRSLDARTLDPRFLFCWMNSREFLHQVAAVKGQTDMAEYVSLRDQRRMKVTVPPIAEQRRIAAILGALDDKIELNRKMNRTLEEMAQALFKSWFVDFDGRADLVDSGSGPVPRGWQVRSLDAIAHFLNGAACQKYPAAEGEAWLPVIKIRELNQGVTSETDRATATIPAKWHVDDGDVLFSWSGSLVVKVWTGGPGALNQHLFKVTSEQYPRWFFLWWVKHHLAEFQRIAADKATTMGHIQRHHLTAARCLVPPPDALRRHGKLLEPLVDRQVANELESGRLADLRDTLLPKLITGELGTPEFDASTTETL